MTSISCTARGPGTRSAWAFALVLAACAAPSDTTLATTPYVTTAGTIAIANLDHQIAQLGDDPAAAELLLVRARFLADDVALDRATTLAEAHSTTAVDLLLRARTRAADHRFADALADLTAAEHAGAAGPDVAALRASILIATGQPSDALAPLEATAARHPGFASHSALASAYAALGRYPEADRLYTTALAELDTTLPFPYAWIYFARALMWTEQAHDPARGEALYTQALDHLPSFVTANIHLAELEVARHDLAPAIARLERVVAATPEPEALALLGQLYLRTGDPARGQRSIARAAERYDVLLAHHPLAFADHAAAFYLGPGADPERAWQLAQQNLANRRTSRAIDLAISAARATGRHRELEPPPPAATSGASTSPPTRPAP